MKKLLTALLTLAMAFTMVFATAASAEDGYKDSITWVIGNDQDILDPQNNVSNSKVMPQYYNGLLGYDNDGNVVCKMAESYEASEDKMTWTFHLRQDVYFHSGRHCTAHDFEATFDRLLNTENPQRYTSNASSFIDTAVATDDYTFVITLKEPKAFFLQAIAKQWAFVLNPEYIEKYGADLGKTAESVDGTGPFKCTQWDKGEVMKFEAFENYYEGAPLTHEIVMKIVPEQTSRAIAVETAQADIADGVSPDDAVRLDALDGVTVSKTDGNGCHLFQFNCASDHAPMSIPAVRFNLTVVLVKFVLEVIDAANCFVQLFLHHFGVGFAALQQVDDLLEFVLYLVYQKNWIVIILIHLVQQFVIGIKGFHFVSSFLRSSQFRHLPS